MAYHKGDPLPTSRASKSDFDRLEAGLTDRIHLAYRLGPAGKVNPKRLGFKSWDRYQVILDLFKEKQNAGEAEPTVTVGDVLKATYERLGCAEAAKVKDDATTKWGIGRGFYRLE